MLKNSLYIIHAINNENNILKAEVELDSNHKIFEGHFPGQPVLPGVCVLQMTREVLETIFNKKIFLLKADDIRFTAMIDPVKNNKIQFQIQYKQTTENSFDINAKILNEDDMICCKIKASYKII